VQPAFINGRALMALLFVGEVMSLYWIVELTLYVLAEKLFPFGEIMSKVAGIMLIIYRYLYTVLYILLKIENASNHTRKTEKLQYCQNA
jgi:hypothetical protein